MRKDNNKSIFTISLLICYLILSFFFLTKFKVATYVNIINPIFWITLLIMSYFFFRKEYVNKKFKKDILLTEIIIIIAFFIIYYLLGLFIGFSNTPYSRTIINILMNIGRAAIIIVSQEYIREKLINRTGRNKKKVIFITVLLIALDLVRYLVVYSFFNGEQIFRFSVEVLCPIIAKHSLLSYLTYNAGLKNSLLYRLVLDCFAFVVPYEPKLGWFLLGIVNIVLPFLVYVKTYEIFEKYEKKDDYHKDKKLKLIYVPIFIILTTMIILVSGVFSHQFIAIASNSMEPKFGRGDAVIIKKTSLDEVSNINVDDIIVYEKENILIVHRVIDKVKDENNQYIYKTKGDYNENEDAGYVKQNQVVGKVTVAIKWIGYPSIMLQELF